MNAAQIAQPSGRSRSTRPPLQPAEQRAADEQRLADRAHVGHGPDRRQQVPGHHGDAGDTSRRRDASPAPPVASTTIPPRRRRCTRRRSRVVGERIVERPPGADPVQGTRGVERDADRDDHEGHGGTGAHGTQASAAGDVRAFIGGQGRCWQGRRRRLGQPPGEEENNASGVTRRVNRQTLPDVALTVVGCRRMKLPARAPTVRLENVYDQEPRRPPTTSSSTGARRRGRTAG